MREGRMVGRTSVGWTQAPRRALAAVAMTVVCWTAPAMAQVAVTDPSNTAQVAKTVTSLSSELASVNKTLTTVGSILNVQHNISGALGALGIGQQDIGGMSVGNLIKDMQMGFQVVGKADQLIAEAHDLEKDPLNAMSLLTQLAAFSQSPSTRISSMNPNITTQVTAMNSLQTGTTSVPNSISTIQDNMFANSLNPTAEQIENVNEIRRAVVQQAAVTSMAQSVSTQQTISDHGQDTLQSLSQGVASASDERGDIKANSAVLLKLVETVSAQNSILSKLLYLESAQNMATQGVYGPLAQPQGVLP